MLACLRFAPAYALTLVVACSDNRALELPELTTDDVMLLFELSDGPTRLYATDAEHIDAIRRFKEAMG